MISVLNNLGKLLKVSNNRISSMFKKTKDTKIFALIFENDIFFGTLSSALGKWHCSQGQPMVSSASLRYKLLTFHKRQ